MMALRNRGDNCRENKQHRSIQMCSRHHHIMNTLNMQSSAYDVTVSWSSSRKAHSSVVLVIHCQNQLSPADCQWCWAYRLIRGKERSHSSAVETVAQDNQWTSGESPPTPHPPLQPQCLHFHKFDNLIRLKDRVRNDSGFLMWFGKERWIPIIQRGKKKGSFWMSNTNSGREVQDAKEERENINK